MDLYIDSRNSDKLMQVTDIRRIYEIEIAYGFIRAINSNMVVDQVVKLCFSFLIDTPTINILKQCRKGLNYYGNCQNNGCMFKNKSVALNRGFGQKINPFDEDFEELIKCPKCNETFELEGYYLYECHCEMKYKLKGLNMKTETYSAEDSKYIHLEISKEDQYEYYKISVFEAK
eukprot:852956_1